MASSSTTRACWLSGLIARTSRQMLSAEVGSLMIRYRSAFWSAAAMPSGVMGFGSNMVSIRLPAENLHQLPQRIEELVHHPLLERNDRIIGNRDVFGTNLGAALGDVAVPDTLGPPKVSHPVLHIQRMHFQCGHMDQEAGTDELLVQMVVAEHVADILAEKALDALAKLLHPVDI